MKLLIPGAAFLVIALGSHAHAATYNVSSNLDNTFGGGGPNIPFSNTVEAPFVGSMSLAYDAATPLANGSYAWTSFTNLTFTCTVAGDGSRPAITFTQANLDFSPSTVYVQIADGNFFFTSSWVSDPQNPAAKQSLSGNSWGGSANFIVESGGRDYLLTTQPLNYQTRMGFGNYVVDYNALYQFVDFTDATPNLTPMDPGYVSGTVIYKGNYGNPTANVTSQGSPSAIPEPAGALTLAGLLGGAAFLRRRRA